MKKTKIPYKSILFRTVQREMLEIRAEIDKKYEILGCENTFCICGIISDVDPEDMFKKSLLFFGDTIDPDFKLDREEAEKRSHETYEQIYSKQNYMVISEED